MKLAAVDASRCDDAGPKESVLSGKEGAGGGGLSTKSTGRRPDIEPHNRTLSNLINENHT